MENLHIYIYEIKRGTKPVALLTINNKETNCAIEKVKKAKLDWVIQECGSGKVNLFFGSKPCINTIKTFIHKPLDKISPQEDFILGIILGYSREKQCERYLDKIA